MPKENKYQFIIAGAGLGGLSFIHHLLKNKSFKGDILILDSDSKRQNDRTWSFWTRNEPDYKCADLQKWNQMGFATNDFTRFENIEPYSYHSIKGIDFYNEVFAEIGRHSNIEFRQESVLDVEQIKGSCIVKTVKNTYESDYVIDSVHRPEISEANYYLNFQHFTGWFIETKEELFNPEKPILMDFRVKQKDAVSFVYLLPYSKTSALVEYTQFSPNKKYSKNNYKRELEKYITNILQIDVFEIKKEEAGSIPMTDFPFDPKPSSRIYRVGTSGGDTKGSTGYTFNFVQNHVKGIIYELSGNRPFKKENLKFKFYDKLLLKIIKEEPEKVKEIMSALFRDQPISRILKFLDEDTNLLEDALIFRTLPWFPFIRALLQRQVNANTL